MSPSALASLLALVLAMSSIQFGASLAKQLFPVLGPVATTMLRTSLAGLMLLAVQRPWRKPITRKAWLLVLPYGAALGIMNTLFYLALRRIPLGLAVALEFTGPLGLALIHSHRRSHLLWVALASFGILSLLPIGDRIDALDPLGIVLALGAGLCWALYIIFGQKVGRELPSAQASCLGICIAALVVLPFGLMQPLGALASPQLWGKALALAFLSSALPYSLEMIALKRMSTHSFGILMSIEPAIATCMGLIFLGEHLSPLQFVAIGAIMVASAGSALSSSPSKKADSYLEAGA